MRYDDRLNKSVETIQHFFNTQAFADGVRATFAILLPALAGMYLGYFDAGIIISLGAMSVSLTDAPGPIKDKRNGMFACVALLFGMVILTSWAQDNIYLLAAIIAASTFFFSMFNVYGTRAGAVGNAAILILILTMDRPLDNGVLIYAGLIVAGGLFYTALSLLSYQLRPYRMVQRVLGDCISEIARYLSVKADFYFSGTELKQDYRNMVSEQIKVHEKQEAVREVMFKTRRIVQETTVVGRKLLLTFVEAIDLFENITATYYDYQLLREQYGDSDILESFGNTLKRMSIELDVMGRAIEANARFRKGFDYDEEIRLLKTKIDALAAQGKSTRILKRILVNIRKILSSFNNLSLYFEKGEVRKAAGDHSRFVEHQSLHPKILWQNFTLDSAVFRHSIRVGAASLAGFIVAKVIDYGHHSYWILLTIAFILKPAFSLTRQRNIERIIGTVSGGILAVIIFLLIPQRQIQFAIMVVFMLGTYSFLRTHYLAMVFCVTPYVLILFRFLGLPLVDLAGERIIDTLIGSAIAFAASHLLLPTWEADQLKVYMKKMLEANAHYLNKIIDSLRGQPINLLEYKLARKNVYVASANLASAFQRMLSEPRSKQVNRRYTQQFVVLNHVLFSNIASVGTQVMTDPPATDTEEAVRPARRAYDQLNRAIQYLDNKAIEDETAATVSKVRMGTESGLKDQLEYIETLSIDVEKTAAKLVQSTT